MASTALRAFLPAARALAGPRGVSQTVARGLALHDHSKVPDKSPGQGKRWARGVATGQAGKTNSNHPSNYPLLLGAACLLPLCCLVLLGAAAAGGG